MCAIEGQTFFIHLYFNYFQKIRENFIDAKRFWGAKKFREGMVNKTKSFVTFLKPAAEIYLEF